MRIPSIARIGVLIASLASCAGAQQGNPAPAAIISVEQPDAERTKEELSRLLEKYPPALRHVLTIDPGLLRNETYLAPYPALAGFLNTHPEINHDPAFYFNYTAAPTRDERVLDFWRETVNGLFVIVGFSMAIGLMVWLIKTLIDYRRWNRLTKVQTDVHTKLFDRFTSNDDLLAYIQSPTGAKFLESSPILLDAAPRNVSAPLGRILWSVQAGLVVAAAGVGFQIVSSRLTVEEAAQPMRALGVLGVALGGGFVVSAVISYFLSRRLGLIPPPDKMTMAGSQQ